MQEGTVSQGTTQPGTGDAPLLLPIHEGFWIWRKRAGIMSYIGYNLYFCNVKEVSQATENQLNLQLLHLRSIIVSFTV